MSDWDGNFNALLPKAAPYPCCMVPENLGAFERLPDSTTPMMEVTTGQAMQMVSGYRRCKACQRRHFFARPMPIES